MLTHRLGICAAALTLAVAPAALAAQTNSQDSDYIAKVSTAAPAAVVASATIMQIEANGSMRTLRAGTNGFTCMLVDATAPMCADAGAMAWMQALVKHAAPPDATGFVYMLAGDNGASNSDPYATAPADGNHWVKTGPHVMIVGASVKSMGYPMSLDPDATRPYVMWPGTPYAHLMIPVSTTQ
ncbi:MAG TPA: hypothetical protein VGX91_10795 [Candidatus Cybelea sp.]|jgi:hypothetical protein|nr:hypothetical protein [Candidatus Cybelea sp.]